MAVHLPIRPGIHGSRKKDRIGRVADIEEHHACIPVAQVGKIASLADGDVVQKAPGKLPKAALQKPLKVRNQFWVPEIYYEVRRKS